MVIGFVKPALAVELDHGLSPTNGDASTETFNHGLLSTNYVSVPKDPRGTLQSFLCIFVEHPTVSSLVCLCVDFLS